MGGDWQHLIQSVVIGLVFSFLLAKLISFVTAFKDDGLSIARGSTPSSSTTSRDGGGAAKPASAQTSQLGSDLGIHKNNSADSLAELSEVGSRLSDDISVMAEKGSTVEPDDIVDEDDSDDDWEGVESTELDEAFSAATAFVAATAADKSHKVSNEVQLQLYGFYKIATEGPCSTPAPPAFKMTARAKWQAWQKLGSMPPEDAMMHYIEIVSELFPTWTGGGEKRGQGRDEDASGTGSTGMMGPVFSSFVHEEEAGNDSKMAAIHDFAREGDLNNLTQCIDSGVSVDLRDSEGRSALHWAVDRGHLDVIELLTSKKADANAKDNEGQTPLHYAVVCDRENIAKYLVDQNADSGIKDNDGLSPADMCEKNWSWLQKEVATGS